MRPSHSAPLLVVSYSLAASAAAVAIAFGLFGYSPPLEEFARPAVFATIAAIAAAGWWLGSHIASPWERIARVAELFRSKKQRDEDPILEVDEIVGLVEKGVEDLLKTKHGLSEAKNLLEYRRLHNERALERSRRALINMLEDVEEANRKLVELDGFRNDFINVTSHELKNPLTPIIANLGMLKQGGMGPVNESQKTALESVERNAMRLKGLISDILDISKLEGRRMKYFADNVDIAGLARQCAVDIGMQAAGKKVTIEVQAEKVPKIKADRDRITQVLSNYLNNAIKFSPQKSSIRIMVEKDGAFVVAKVKDSGPGIPKDEQKRLFELFSQGKSVAPKNREGSGLGLAISRWIVEDHGGEVWVESRSGHGSTFCLKLPVKFGPRSRNFMAGSDKSI